MENSKSLKKDSRIFVAGATTLPGSAILNTLDDSGYKNIIKPDISEEDFFSLEKLEQFFIKNKPEFIFAAVGKSGGIGANLKFPADLMTDNLVTGSNIIRCSHKYNVKKLLYVASSCCYPRNCPQPMQENSLFTGPFESSNESYSVAKTSCIKLCQAYYKQFKNIFISVIPATIFGPGDDFSLDNSHVITALIRKIHDAKENNKEFVELWGSGTPRREFIYSDDFGKACLFLMKEYDEEIHINIGVGYDVSIADLALIIKKEVGYSGSIRFDTGKPDGVPVKLLDSVKLLDMGWKPFTSLEEGIKSTYRWFIDNHSTILS